MQQYDQIQHSDNPKTNLLIKEFFELINLIPKLYDIYTTKLNKLAISPKELPNILQQIYQYLQDSILQEANTTLSAEKRQLFLDLLLSLQQSEELRSKFIAEIQQFVMALIANDGYPKILTNKHSAFKIGENIAITKGHVIYQNELMQLIQYSPVTQQIYTTPILLVPAMINKFYILDLSQRNSLVKWLVNRGFMVFIISWVNPDQSLAEKNWQDYILQGPVAAINSILKNTTFKQVHLAGYCLGGTLLATAIAYLQQKFKKNIASASYFATLLDFKANAKAYDLLNRKTLTITLKIIKEQKLLPGKLLALAFKLLRPLDLIYMPFIKHHILKESPQALDFLFWSEDHTNLPKRFSCYYLTKIFIKNHLQLPNKLKCADLLLDLTKITTPSCFVAAIKDHIVPWQACYAGVKTFKGPVNFILTGSGHVAGIINPPSQNKYYYYTNCYIKDDPNTWLDTAQQKSGSWWPAWEKWLLSYDSNTVEYTPIMIQKISENLGTAPGTYVFG